MLIDPKQIDLSGYAGIDDFNNHLHDGDILEHDGVDSDGGAYPFTTTGTVTFNQEIVAKDAALTEFASGDETIAHVLNDTINCGELHTITVTDEGGINISWDSGTLWDCVEKNIVTTDASGSTGCTDNSINYLYWDRSGGGTALTLGVTHPDHEDHDILVAIIVCQATDIYEIHSVNILSDREEQTSVAMRDILRVVVTDGLIVSEDTDATNAFDVEISAGTFFHFGTTRHELAAGFNTRTTAMTRWFHSSGAWTNDSNAQIDMTQWDDLTDLTGSISVNKYYKSIFMYSENMIHWIYPQVEYDTVAQAIGAPLPTIPVTGEFFPRSVAVIMRGNATAFPTAGSTQWIDIRPLFGTSITGIVTDHGNLAGLSDDDHIQYSLVNGTRGFTAVISGIYPLNSGHLATKEYVDEYIAQENLWDRNAVNGYIYPHTLPDKVGIGKNVPLTELDVSGVINVSTGYRILNAATLANYLRGDGTNFISSAIQLSDVPAHNILSATHGDTLTGTVVAGDVIIGNSTPKFSRLAISIPAASVRNVLGIDNGETIPSWKTALDSTNPTTIAVSASASPGTSLIFSHRDHTHGAPATWTATAHNVLSAIHGDTLTASVVRGDIIIGNATPKWSRLAKGTDGYFLKSNATDVAWSALPGGFTGFANPSATIGLTVVNGSATTAMRSDGAPALSQAIAPTWTNDHIWGTDKKVIFRDSALFINSIADGYMDFTADTAFRFNTSNVGIGITPLYKLHTAIATVDNVLMIDNYHASTDSQAILALQKSYSDTIGTLVVTTSGAVLGRIDFNGVRTIGPTRNTGATITCVCTNEAPPVVQVEATLILETYKSTPLYEKNTNQLYLYGSNGYVGINCVPQYQFHVSGNTAITSDGNNPKICIGDDLISAYG